MVLPDSIAHYRSWIACCLGRGRRAPMGEEDLELLADQVGEQPYAGGTFVFRRGDPSAKIHVLRSGSLELSREIGGRPVALQILRPGDVFGDVPAFLGEDEPFDARALEDCTILSIDAAALFELLRTRPLVAQRWFISLAERMKGLQDRLVDVLAGGLEAQLASILLREGCTSGEVHLTQDRLADMVGSARTSVQRVLKGLEGKGVIELRYRRIVLVDQDALASLNKAET